MPKVRAAARGARGLPAQGRRRLASQDPDAEVRKAGHAPAGRPAGTLPMESARPTEPSAAPRPLPRWCFLLAMALTLAALGVLAHGAWRSQRIVRGFEETHLAT